MITVHKNAKPIRLFQIKLLQIAKNLESSYFYAKKPLFSLVSVNGYNRATPEKGYYLLECVVALAILGLFCAAQPLQASLLGPLRLQQAANQVLQSLDNFAQIARWYGSTIEGEFNPGSSDYRLFRYPAASNQSPILVDALPTGVSIDSFRVGGASGQASLKLYANGSASPASLVLTSNDRYCTIYQSLRGSRRVECW